MRSLKAVAASKKPTDVQMMEKMRSAMKKCCMHPDQAHCKGKIKEAHALQNNKIISLLAGTDRHVYMINTKKKPLLIPIPDGEVILIVELSKTKNNYFLPFYIIKPVPWGIKLKSPSNQLPVWLMFDNTLIYSRSRINSI